MRTQMTIKAIVLGVALGVCAGTQAATISAIDAGAGGGFVLGSSQAGATNDVIGAQSGYYGAALWLDTAATVEFTYLGYEAGWTNLLSINNQGGNTWAAVWNNKTTTLGTTYEYSAAAGLLSFQLCAHLSNSQCGSINNGDNNLATDPVNFWVGEVVGEAGSWYIGLDDGGGRRDSDYDDLVAKVRVSEVPVPGTLGLIGLGLAGLGLVRRKQQA